MSKEQKPIKKIIFILHLIILTACGDVNVSDPDVDVNTGETSAATEESTAATEPIQVETDDTTDETDTETSKDATVKVSVDVDVEVEVDLNADTETQASMDCAAGKLCRGMSKAEVLEITGNPTTIGTWWYSDEGSLQTWKFTELGGEEYICEDRWVFDNPEIGSDDCRLGFDKSGNLRSSEHVSGEIIDPLNY
jgi:hypothetical protein